MNVVELPPDIAAVDLARECLFRFLATALLDPVCPHWRPLLSADTQALARRAAELLRDEALAQPIELGFGELPPGELDLGPVLAHLRGPVERHIAEYDRVFGLVIAKECPPYETEYHPARETFQRTQELADVAGFYRAFGIEPSASRPERPDHIALELEFMAFLGMKKRLALEAWEGDLEAAERARVCDDAAGKFFAAHLAWWVPAFAAGLRRKAGEGLYVELANVLAAWVPAERGRLNIPAPPHPARALLIERPEEQSGCTGCV